MLQRIQQLMEEKEDFAFETTLSTRSYVSLIKTAKTIGYETNLLYFWLASPEFAKQRVASRVSEGGHNIPTDVIERRYYRGISNLFNLYLPIVNNWIVIDNMDTVPNIIAKGSEAQDKMIINSELWNILLKQSMFYGK
jgi:predicted ABC-type ATPase